MLLPRITKKNIKTNTLNLDVTVRRYGLSLLLSKVWKNAAASLQQHIPSSFAGCEKVNFDKVFVLSFWPRRSIAATASCTVLCGRHHSRSGGKLFCFLIVSTVLVVLAVKYAIDI